MKLVTPKPPMNPIDLRTDLEAIDAQLRGATTPDETRRLNAKRRTIEKKLLKVRRRELRENDGQGHKSPTR